MTDELEAVDRWILGGTQADSYVRQSWYKLRAKLEEVQKPVANISRDEICAHCDNLSQSIITLDVHFSDKEERLCHAWDIVHAKLVEGQKPITTEDEICARYGRSCPLDNVDGVTCHSGCKQYGRKRRLL